VKAQDKYSLFCPGGSPSVDVVYDSKIMACMCYNGDDEGFAGTHRPKTGQGLQKEPAVALKQVNKPCPES
jgi:hypothetical protein